MIFQVDYTFGTKRTLIGLALGVAVTLFFLWLMQFLIYVAERVLDEEKAARLIDFVRSDRNEEVRTDDAVEAPPPVEAMPQSDVEDDWEDSDTLVAVAAPKPQFQADIKSGSGGQEGDYLPIIKVPPNYPTAARDRGIEGFCVVEYVVTSDGTTRDVQVLEDQCSSSLFHRASIRAAKKFRYKPRVVNGVRIEVPGVQNMFTYKLDN